jgi:WD40 repeat protein
MTATDQATCVFASTSRATPIHLWDAVTGSLRASYIAYDHLDEPVAACAVAFSGDGARIFAGYDKRVRVWDASRPGRDCDEWKTNDGRRRGWR